MRIKWIWLLLFCVLTVSCEKLAVLTTPAKEPIPSHSQLAMQAENNFWSTLHQGNYQGIAKANHLLMAAYLQNPNDPTLAAHLGFLHIWKITERQRYAKIPPEIVNEIILSNRYFKQAVQLDPADARYLGFYGDTQLVQGQIFHDEREQVRGYFTLKRAINKWPEFNYFTAGYVMSVLPPERKEFKEALAWQWKTVDLCAGAKVNRANPDFSPYMHQETQKGSKRACWNSWIAPYNFEGFFLNMGDMLVKSGDPITAIKIYQNAKLAKNYSSWPYKKLLEQHLALAKQNVMHFQNESNNPKNTILFNSGYGCVACHQSTTRT